MRGKRVGTAAEDARPSAVVEKKSADPAWLAAFADYLRAECHLAENTIVAYRRDLRRFYAWLGERRVPALDVRQLAEYAGWLHKQSLAPASLARHLVSLKLFFRYLQLEGVLRDNKVELLGTQKLWQRVPVVFTPSQIDDLFVAPKPGDPCWRRDRALLEMLYATGCRASELAHLRLEDVHLEAGFCICHGKGDKQRMVPIGRRAAQAVQTYMATERPKLAERVGRAPWLLLSRRGRRMRRERIWELVKRYVSRIGGPADASPHTLRHSFATHMLMGGADLRQVQEMLGHASITTTQKYTHVDHSRLKAVHRQFHPRG